MLRRLFGPKSDDVTGSGEKYIIRSLMIGIPPQHCSGDQTIRMRWAGHVARWGRAEVHTGFWWGYLRERGHFEDPGLDGRIILRWIYR
jgi:hypothetical protein